MSDTVDEGKVEKTIQKLHAVFNKANLNVQEILLVYGNLGYHLGASLAGFTNQGPNLEILKKLYYADPTVDVGLMIQGLMITTWEEDWTKKPRLSQLAELNRKEK
jgi:hypothetical protein